MIRIVERYQTADGKLFETEKDALEHIADQCRAILDESTRPLVNEGRMTLSEQYRLIMTMIPDAQAAKQLTQRLLANFSA